MSQKPVKQWALICTCPSCGYCQGLSQKLNGVVENCLNGTRERGLSLGIIWDKLLKAPPNPDTQFT